MHKVIFCYPLESDADLSGLEYICCVAIGLKSQLNHGMFLKKNYTKIISAKNKNNYG